MPPMSRRSLLKLAGLLNPAEDLGSNRIVFATALPREDSGKIFKRKLRAPYWEKAGRAI